MYPTGYRRGSLTASRDRSSRFRALRGHQETAPCAALASPGVGRLSLPVPLQSVNIDGCRLLLASPGCCEALTGAPVPRVAPSAHGALHSAVSAPIPGSGSAQLVPEQAAGGLAAYVLPVQVRRPADTSAQPFGPGPLVRLSEAESLSRTEPQPAAFRTLPSEGADSAPRGLRRACAPARRKMQRLLELPRSSPHSALAVHGRACNPPTTGRNRPAGRRGCLREARSSARRPPRARRRGGPLPPGRAARLEGSSERGLRLVAEQRSVRQHDELGLVPGEVRRRGGRDGVPAARFRAIPWMPTSPQSGRGSTGSGGGSTSPPRSASR